MLDDKYKQLEMRYQEIQDLYDNRPSKQEDLEMIKALKKDCIYKDNLLKKQMEDMKKYKLELENREYSYNKMFGKNPNVGHIDPRAKENVMAGQGAMTVAQPG